MNERRARRPVTRRETGSRGPLTTGAFAPIIAEPFPLGTAVSSPREAGMAPPDPGCPSPAGSPADTGTDIHEPRARTIAERPRPGTACRRGPAGSVRGRRTRSRSVRSRAPRPGVGTARRSSVHRASWSEAPHRPGRPAAPRARLPATFLAIQMTGSEATGPDLAPFRLLAPAVRHNVRTAGVKTAPGGRLHGIGHFPRQDDPLPPRRRM